MTRLVLPDDFDRTARRDWRVWLALIGGGAALAFAQLASTAPVCAASGTCSAPITAIVSLVGLVLLTGGALALWRNPSRGSRFDPVTGELHWWQHRHTGQLGHGGQIHPTDIMRFTIHTHDEGEETIYLIDQAGEVRLWFDAEVLPRRERAAWFDQVGAAYPHITINRR